MELSDLPIHKSPIRLSYFFALTKRILSKTMHADMLCVEAKQFAKPEPSLRVPFGRDMMTKKLAGMVALLTGGSRGISAASATRLARDGVEGAISDVPSIAHADAT